MRPTTTVLPTKSGKISKKLRSWVPFQRNFLQWLISTTFQCGSSSNRGLTHSRYNSNWDRERRVRLFWDCLENYYNTTSIANPLQLQTWESIFWNQILLNGADSTMASDGAGNGNSLWQGPYSHITKSGKRKAESDRIWYYLTNHELTESRTKPPAKTTDRRRKEVRQGWLVGPGSNSRLLKTRWPEP